MPPSRPVETLERRGERSKISNLLELSDLENGQSRAQGRAINRATESAGGTLNEIETFVREQPFSAAFIALGIGYIIGRLRLL